MSRHRFCNFRAKIIPCILLCTVAIATADALEVDHKTTQAYLKGQVVFIGDSITFRWGSDGNETFNRFYLPLGTVNTAISGEETTTTTTTIINRINDEGILDNLHSYLAVLKIGTHDLGNGVPVSEVVSNIGTILNLIRVKLGAGSRILLLGILPRTGEDIFAQIRTVNRDISTFADNSSVFFLNMESSFSTEIGTIIPELFLEDGIHPSSKGYEIWAERMNPLFNAILNAPFPSKAVWIGDSLMGRWLQNPDYPGGAPVWNEKYVGLSSSNFAVGGHTTSDQINRIRNENVLQGLNPKIAVVMIGTNDLTGGIAEHVIASNIKRILDLVLEKCPHVRILLLGILPRSGVAISTRAENVNAIIENYDDGDRIRFLNMRDQFRLELGIVRPDLYADGTHLTLTGYEVWSLTMDSLFQQLIRFT